MDSENPSVATLNQKVEIAKIAQLYQLQSCEATSKMVIGLHKRVIFFPVDHNLFKKGFHMQLCPLIRYRNNFVLLFPVPC